MSPEFPSPQLPFVTSLVCPDDIQVSSVHNFFAVDWAAVVVFHRHYEKDQLSHAGHHEAKCRMCEM